MTTLFILGAADPEMAAIESLLVAAGQSIAIATVGGKRCHGGNAYKCDGVTCGVDGYDRIVLVECDLPGWFAGDPSPEVVRCDHHRPGDPGFGLSAEDYDEAASIAQVRRLLHDADLITRTHLDEACPDWLLIAAADHCLEAAYAGRCPGVHPASLVEFRCKQKAEFRKVDPAVVEAEIEAAKAILRERASWHHVEAYPGADAYCPNCDTGEHGDCMHPASDYHYADLRDDGVIPELPEAACITSIPYLATVTEPTGRKKVVLGAAGRELVKAFLDGKVVPGLVDHYGDPARGFAGGYVS